MMILMMKTSSLAWLYHHPSTSLFRVIKLIDWSCNSNHFISPWERENLWWVIIKLSGSGDQWKTDNNYFGEAKSGRKKIPSFTLGIGVPVIYSVRPIISYYFVPVGSFSNICSSPKEFSKRRNEVGTRSYLAAHKHISRGFVIQTLYSLHNFLLFFIQIIMFGDAIMISYNPSIVDGYALVLCRIVINVIFEPRNVSCKFSCDHAILYNILSKKIHSIKKWVCCGSLRKLSNHIFCYRTTYKNGKNNEISFTSAQINWHKTCSVK